MTDLLTRASALSPAFYTQLAVFIAFGVGLVWFAYRLGQVLRSDTSERGSQGGKR